MSGSRDETLNSLELLELILLQVDMQTLLTSGQLVSKRFNYIIDQSPQLQRKLFFQSTPPFSDNIDLINPLIKKHQDKLGIHWLLSDLNIRFVSSDSKVPAVYILFKKDLPFKFETDIKPSWLRTIPIHTGRKDRVWLAGKIRDFQPETLGHGVHRFVQLTSPRLYDQVAGVGTTQERRYISPDNGHATVGDWDGGDHHFFGMVNSMGRPVQDPSMGDILHYVHSGRREDVYEEHLEGIEWGVQTDAEVMVRMSVVRTG